MSSHLQLKHIRIFTKTNHIPLATIIPDGWDWKVFAFDHGTERQLKDFITLPVLCGLTVIHRHGDEFFQETLQYDHPDFPYELADYLSTNNLHGVEMYAVVEDVKTED